MYRYFVSAFLLLFVFACSSDKNPSDQGDRKIDDGKRLVRKKIDKLDAKSYVEITIDLTREKAKWEDEWLKFMQQKRKEYFDSFGLTEKQYIEFPEKNSGAMQRFLTDNPQYNRELMDANQRYNQQNP